MKKVLLTATVQSHICQFHKVLSDMLHEQGYEVHVAAKDNLATKAGLDISFADKVFDVPFSRSPKSLSNIKAYGILKKIINENNYDVIHCNTPICGAITRLAAKKQRKNGTKVIYTAHGFHFYDGAPLTNWMLYYPIEKVMSKYTDVLITINSEDYKLAKEKFHAKKTCLIPGVGVDFRRLETSETREQVRARLGFSEDDFVLLSIGELNENKNNITILKAMDKLKNPKIKYAMAGNGPLRDYLEEEAVKMGILENITFLGYTREIGALHKAADAFCFPSIREGLGLASIEAMHSGLPLITSEVRGIRDYSEDGITGYTALPLDSEGFAEGIKKLIDDRELGNEFGRKNSKASLKYGKENVSEMLEKIYLELDD